MGKKLSKLERKAFDLPKNGIPPTAPEQVKAEEKKIKLKGKAKKIWKQIKKQGIARVDFADDIKDVDVCRAVISKLMAKDGGTVIARVAGITIDLSITASPGPWLFVWMERLPVM